MRRNYIICRVSTDSSCFGFGLCSGISDAHDICHSFLAYLLVYIKSLDCLFIFKQGTKEHDDRAKHFVCDVTKSITGLDALVERATLLEARYKQRCGYVVCIGNMYQNTIQTQNRMNQLTLCI